MEDYEVTANGHKVRVSPKPIQTKGAKAKAFLSKHKKKVIFGALAVGAGYVAIKVLQVPAYDVVEEIVDGVDTDGDY